MDQNNFRHATWKLLGSLLFILYASEMFELVVNRLFEYADDSTLLAVVHKPADRPAVAASLNMDLARIQEWCKILNPNKTNSSVVRRSRLNSPHGDFILSGVSIQDSPNLNILGVKVDSQLTFKDHVRGIVSHVSQRIGVLRLVKRICTHLSVTLLLFCIYSSNGSVLFSSVGVSC